jgi:amino acid permease
MISSAAAIISVFYLVGLVVVFRFASPYEEIINNPENPIVLFNFSFDIFLAFPILIFSQNCHILSFPILKEMKSRSVGKMEWSTRFAVFIYGSVYLLVGVMGYISFYGLTNENILKNYVSKRFNLAISLAQLGISFTAIFSFPLQTFELKDLTNLVLLVEML